jgi:hypothetical protein
VNKKTLDEIFSKYADKDLLIQYYVPQMDEILYRTTYDLNTKIDGTIIFLGMLAVEPQYIISVTTCEGLFNIYNHNIFGEFITKENTITKLSEEPFKFPEKSRYAKKKPMISYSN